MKVKYIIMKMVDRRSSIMKDVAEMGAKNYEFFEQMMSYIEGEYFLAGQYKTKIMQALNIKSTTFWARIKYMEKKTILKKTSKGIYKINSNWVRVFDVDPKKK